ncbi:MAG: hypothetical protein FJ315_01420 [SAR202 cluster bacterium]|nr:hypothetical protein [SAR202 cluster bacterium]
MPEPMTTFFIHNWLGGQSVSNAANNAYNATIPFYTVVYPPSPRVRYKTITYEYPCGVEVDPRNPLNTRVKMCSGTKDIPDGVDLVTNSKVTETRLVVSGDGSCRF